MRRARTIGAMAVLLGSASSGTATTGFTAPADGKLTDGQVTAYLAVLKARTAERRSTATTRARTSAPAEDLHGLSAAELAWVDGQLTPLWPIAGLHAKQADLAADRATQATYEAARRDGRRVVTAAERSAAAAAVTAAEDAVQAIEDEAKGNDRDVVDLQAAAAGPPATMPAADRPAYVDRKKQEAETARIAGRVARDRLPDAKQALDDAKDRLATLDQQLADPNVPFPADERPAVDQTNDRAIAAAKSAVDADRRAIAALTRAVGTGAPTKPDADNLALAERHVREYWAAVGDPAAAK
jgi:hypothetical protein